MSISLKEAKRLVKELDELDELTDWESRFIESMVDWVIEQNRHPTEKQSNILQRMEEDYL